METWFNRRRTRRAVLGGVGTGALGLLALSAGCRRDRNTKSTQASEPPDPTPQISVAPFAAPSTTATRLYFPPATGDGWESLNVSSNG